jgi:phthiocerol/phenolphthiocerol synthesis type-I polyketide synthase E
MSGRTEQEREITPGNEPIHSAGQWRDGVAIIGMSARFPRSRNVQEFWERLLAGEILISEFSSGELRKAGIDEATLSNPDYVRRGNAIDDADFMDAEFFGLSKREAEVTDPQQRVFLECAWEALEHAGYTGDGERVGVFAGVGMNTYFLQLLSNPAVIANTGGYQLMLANDKDFLATRVAYKLNLRGPAVAVQTACSTSLAAVHLACQSILSGECDMALAGGVSIPFPQSTGYLYMPGMILSPDGYCRPFDVAARGTVPGRGAGIVVLKRLSQAHADEDLIYAVIRGSAWNNDGGGKVGYTAPSIDGQAAVIRQALAAAGVTADRLGYVEAHGTATELGDPIEVAALTTVFAESNALPGSCVLGAVKANMGHADVAAGVAGLIKAALAVNAGIIPPTPNFAHANPSLELDKGPFVVSSSSMPWPSGRERWAGVSSFGIGGTNVHVVLSGEPERSSRQPVERPNIFPISARTPTALAAACGRLADRLDADASLILDDVAATLQLGRREFAFRRAVVASNRIELAGSLRNLPKNRELAPLDLRNDVVFLFPGQGQQFVGMAEELYRTDALIRNTINDGASRLRDALDLDVVELIAGQKKNPELKSRLTDTSVAQPVLFLIEYALVARWRSLGVEPSALLGHSLGELTAACIAGVFCFDDALRLAAARGRLMAQTPPGIMLAVSLPPDRLANYIEKDVWLAAENGPKMSVASGLTEAIVNLERRLSAERIACVRLASRNAFHTPLMADAAKAFRQEVESVERHAPTIPWLSNVTGTWIEPAEAQSARYWGSQILSRVRFTQNLSALADRYRFLLEVGPGDALIGIARHQLPKSITAPSLGAENRRSSDEIIFLEAAARACECGISLSWQGLRPGAGKRRIPLPTYPFERQRYWIEPAAPAEPKVLQAAPSSELRGVLPETADGMKRKDISSWFYVPSWQSTPSPSIASRPETASVDCWLVLLDRSDLGEALAAGLSQKGATIITVAAADGFKQVDAQFTINPAQPGHYERLWQEIGNLGLRPAGLIILWTMRGMQVQTYDSLVLLLQAASKYRQRFHQIEIVSDDLENVYDEVVEEVQRAEILGLIRVLPSEYRGLHCRSIDVSMSAGKIDQIVLQILDEIAVTGGGLTVAYRRGIRWQKNWMSAPLRESSDTSFRNRGVYLITGGVGGIGYSVARYLLQTHQARVILTGRTSLPERGGWDAWVAAHSEDDPVTRRILRMRELERAGGEVQFVSADVCDKEAMAGVFDSARKQFGKIDGVLHAAGLPGGATVASQDLEEAAGVRNPKVQGSLVLAELLREQNPDFFLLFSSISSVFPAAAQGAYAAANAFQNYFADYCRNILKLPAVAIDFGPWQEVGMAAEMVLPEGFEALKEENLRAAMTVPEGIEVVRRVLLGWQGPQILASPVAIDAILSTQTVPELATGERERTLPLAADTELAAVLEIWKELLAVDDIAPSDNFFELGGHSLMGTMVISRIQDRFGAVLTLRTLFESPTALALAEALRRMRQTVPAAPVAIMVPDESREEFEI